MLNIMPNQNINQASEKKEFELRFCKCSKNDQYQIIDNDNVVKI